MGCIGWSVVNSIIGAQTLRAVFNDAFPITVGIIIWSHLLVINGFIYMKVIHGYQFLQDIAY